MGRSFKPSGYCAEKRLRAVAESEYGSEVRFAMDMDQLGIRIRAEDLGISLQLRFSLGSSATFRCDAPQSWPRTAGPAANASDLP